MKKCISLIVLLFISYFASSQTNHVSVKTSIEELKQNQTWYFLLGLNDGSSVFLWANSDITKIFMKHFDKEAKSVLETQIWELASPKKGQVEISEIYEINKTILFSMTLRTNEGVKFFKLIIDPTTGGKINEEVLTSYEGIKHKFLDNENCFFNCTKNDSLGLYRLMNYTRIDEKISELKIYDYDYNHKLISSFSKKIEKAFKTVSLLSSIQVGQESFYALCYREKDIYQNLSQKDEYKNKEADDLHILIYKYAKSVLLELPIILKKIDLYRSDFGGLYTKTRNNQVKLAICNMYSLEEYEAANVKASYITVVTFDKNTLKVENQYEITQNTIREAFIDTNNVYEKERKFLFNVPINFRTNNNNQDEFMFHSYKSIMRAGYRDEKTEDIGFFVFNDKGKVIKQNFIPFKTERVFSLPFPYSSFKNGRTGNFYLTTAPKYFSNKFDFISKNNTFFVLYNDLPENLNAKTPYDVKIANSDKMSGVVLTNNENGWNKSSILDPKERTAFNFISSSFNEKTGIYSVVSRDESKKLHVSYFSIK